MTGVVPPVEVILLVVPETLVTPVPAGVAHVPSPRQNVVAEALVPLFKCVTARFPDTKDAKSIAVPFQTPVVIVPKVVRDVCPTYVAAMSITGVVPPVEVMRFRVPDTLVTVPPEGATQAGIPPTNVKANPFVVAASFERVFAAEA
jgi:hypothetical protein